MLTLLKNESRSYSNTRLSLFTVPHILSHACHADLLGRNPCWYSPILSDAILVITSANAAFTILHSGLGTPRGLFLPSGFGTYILFDIRLLFHWKIILSNLFHIRYMSFILLLWYHPGFILLNIIVLYACDLASK